MAKNRKTIRNGFTYLQCDDFADYLSQMAAQGWHFKEWGTGLVFEKGEPEDAVYAVEVFIKGSSYDLRPSADALDFSDYCEQAGWKLMDSKQKYCIFKQMRPDAVPIVTPEERIQNATKAYMNQFGLQIAIVFMSIINVVLRFFPTSQFIDTLFSNFQLFNLSFWLLYILCTAEQVIWFIVWKRKAKKRFKAGEYKFLRHRQINFLNWILFLIMIPFCLLFVAQGYLWIPMIAIGIVLLTLIMSLLLAKFRPDRETNIGIVFTIPIALTIIMIVVIFCIVATTNTHAPISDDFPLFYEDFAGDAGALEDSHSKITRSIFGAYGHASLYYEDVTLTYDLYKTEHDWILDVVWDYQLTFDRNAEPIDCTALWDSNLAFYNHTGEYYVRYDNLILIFDLHAEANLTEEQVAIIRDALKLEG